MVQIWCLFFNFKLKYTLLCTTFCWAWSASQLLRATYSFQHLRLGPPLSMQCIIDGVPTHAAPGDMNNIDDVDGTYESSACVALRFVQRRGCDLDANYPYVGHRQADRPYSRVSNKLFFVYKKHRLRKPNLRCH